MAPSLVAFTRGFAPPSWQIFVSTFRLPAWIWSWPVPQQTRGISRPRARLGRTRVNRQSPKPRVLQVDQVTTISNAKGEDVPPKEPRTQSPHGHQEVAPENVDSFQFPLSLLQSYKKKSSRGLLPTLALRDADLKTFFSLAKALVHIERRPDSFQDERLLVSEQSHLSWGAPASITLEECTENWYSFEKELGVRITDVTLRRWTEDWRGEDKDQESRAYHEAIGELWYAVGELIIRASNTAATEADRLMQTTYLILADMHSNGLIPSETYGFEESNIQKTRRKPPYLHTLGSRIMATLSDATWKAQDHGRLRVETTVTSGLPESFYDDPNPRVRRLFPNVWLEFVLWSCVRRRYFIEAAKLLANACLAQGQENWMALAWDEVLELQTDHHRRHQSWFDRVMTLVEGYSEEAPLIEMPPKTISSEVVLSILDGLLSLSGDTDGVRSARKVAFFVYCRSALGNLDAYNSLALLSLAQEISKTADLDAVVIGDLLLSEGVADTSINQISLNGVSDSSPEEEKETPTLPAEFAQEQPMLLVNHLISTLDAQAMHGDVVDAMATFDRIRKLRRTILEPLATLHPTDMSDHYPSLNPSGSREQHRILEETLVPGLLGTGLEIPNSTLSALLQLVVNTQNLETARSILYDEGLISLTETRDPILRPALFQVAIALSDKHLLQNLVLTTRGGYEEMSDDVLYRVFEAHIGLQDFQEARSILETIKTERHLALPLRLAAVVASNYVTLEHCGLTDSPSVASLRKLMSDILSGGFLPPRNPSQALDYTRPRELLQLGRIVQSALKPKDRLHELDGRLAHSQLKIATSIPTDAFNVLLETIVKLRGPGPARAFFDQWCSLVPSTSISSNPQTIEDIPVIQPRFEGTEKVVTPTLESVQIVLRSPLEELRAFNKEPYMARLRSKDPTRRLLRWVDAVDAEHSESSFTTKLSGLVPNREILEWGAVTLRRMGLDEASVNEMIPGTFPMA